MPSPPGRADLRTPAWVAGPGSSMSGETGSAQAAQAASPRPGHMLAHKPAPASNTSSTNVLSNSTRLELNRERLGEDVVWQL